MEKSKVLLIKNMKRLRKTHDWTQEDLSEKSGISLGFIREIETGKALGSAITLDKIAEALNVQIHELFLDEVPTKEDGSIDLIRKIASLDETGLATLQSQLIAIENGMAKRKSNQNQPKSKNA